MFAFELSVCLACMAGFGYLFVDALGMPYPQEFWDGPGAFPAVLSTLLFLLCLYWLVDTVLGRMRNLRKSEAEISASAPQEPGNTQTEWKRLVLIISLTVLYIMVLMPLITFPFATFVFLFITIKIFSQKGWLLPFIVSVVATGIVVLVFNYVLYLPMPR